MQYFRFMFLYIFGNTAFFYISIMLRYWTSAYYWDTLYILFMKNSDHQIRIANRKSLRFQKFLSISKTNDHSTYQHSCVSTVQIGSLATIHTYRVPLCPQFLMPSLLQFFLCQIALNQKISINHAQRQSAPVPQLYFTRKLEGLTGYEMASLKYKPINQIVQSIYCVVMCN